MDEGVFLELVWILKFGFRENKQDKTKVKHTLKYLYLFFIGILDCRGRHKDFKT